MVTAVALPVYELLTVPERGNKAYGFGLIFLPDVNGADGVTRIDNNSNKPEWIPSGPWNARVTRRGEDKGVEIKHIEVKRDKVILNHHYVYDRAGFIALKFTGSYQDDALKAEDVMLSETVSLKDAANAILAHSILVNK